VTFREFVDGEYVLGDRLRPVSWSPVLEALSAIERPGVRRVALCCPRRSGKSTAACAAALWHALTTDNAFVLLVSATLGSISDQFRQKFGPILRGPLRDLRPDVSQHEVRFPENGSIVKCVSPSEAAVLGKSITMLIVDECRLVEEETVRLLEPSTFGMGRSIFIGTAGRPRTWWADLFKDPEPTTFSRIFSSVGEAGNPGIDIGSEAEEARRRAERGTDWQRLLYKRDFESVFVELTDSPLVSPVDVEKAVVSRVAPFDEKLDRCITACDLSTTGRDLSSVVTVALRNDIFRVLEVRTFRPEDFGAAGVSFDLVERAIALAARRYRSRVVMDRHEGFYLAQRLRAARVQVRDFAVSAMSNQDAFSALAETLHGGRLQWERCERLEREILSLVLEDTASGFKVRDSDKRYHRDLSFSLAIGVLELSRRSTKFKAKVFRPGGAFQKRKGREFRPRRLRREPVPDVPGVFPWPGPPPETVGERLSREVKEAEAQYERCAARLLGQGVR